MQRQSGGAEKKKKKKGREEEEGDKASSGSDHRRQRRRSPDLKPVMPSSHFPSNFVPRYERRKKILSHEEPPPLSPPSLEENLQIKREKGTDGACVSCRCHHSITFRRRTAVTRLAISPVRTSPVFFKALSLIPQTTHKINSGLPRLIFNSAPQSKPAFLLTRNRFNFKPASLLTRCWSHLLSQETGPNFLQ